MKHILIAVFLLIGVQSCKKKDDLKGAVPSKQVISIKVVDGNDTPIPKAQVTVEPDLCKNIETDEYGKCQTPPATIGSNYQVTVDAKGYKIKMQNLSVIDANAGNPTLTTIKLEKDSPLTFTPPVQLIFDAKNVNQSIDVTNSGVLGDIKLEYINPAAQWISSMTPKESILVPATKTVRILINVDPKGLPIDEYKTKLNYSYYSLQTPTYKGNGELDVIMKVTTQPITLKPVVSNFSPVSAKYGTSITINGQNFETDTSKISVFFNDKKATITSVNKNQIITKVPLGAKSGKIKVKVGTLEDVSINEFEYLYTYRVSEVTSVTSPMYINDIAVGNNGTIYLSAVQVLTNTNIIANNAILELTKTGTGYSEKTLIGGTPGITDGNTGINASGKMVYPTKLFFYNNSLYFADNFDPKNHTVSGVNDGFASLRRITGSVLKTLYKIPLNTNEFIHDLIPVNINGFNGVLFVNNNFYKFDFNTSLTTKVADYDGLNVFLDKDSKSIYLLNLDPSDGPNRWKFNRKEVLNSNQISSSPNLIGTANLGKTTGQYFPKGMVVDTENNLGFVFDNNSSENYNIYQIKLDTKVTTLIYSGKKGSGFENDILNEGGSLNSISCLTFDAANKRVLFVDVYRNNVIRAMTYQ